MKKSISVGIATAALFAACSTTAMAAPSVVVDAQTLTLDQPPVIVDSRTMVPMRAIFEALGSDVEWMEDSQMVLAQKNLQYISMAIGDSDMYVDGTPVKLDVPAQIINGRTMVPLRAVSEALNATVAWDEATETVTVQSADQGTHPYTNQTYRETKNNAVLDMAYPQFTGNQAALTDLNKQLAAASHSRATAILQDFGQLIDETMAPSIICTAKERYAVTYNQKNYVSLLFETVQNTGGAHPMTVRTSSVYDVTTGKALALTDILKGDQKAIDNLVLQGFTAEINAHPDAFYDEAKDALAKAVAAHSYGYYLSEKGLTFYFQLYEIAPYAAGFSEYTLPFSQANAFQLSF